LTLIFKLATVKEAPTFYYRGRKNEYKIISKIAILAFTTIALASCATKAKKIEAAYVSPIGYEAYSCDQLGLEAQRVSSRAGELSGQQDKQATKDAVAVGVSLILFWPAAFLVKGDNTTAAEISRLKGEMNAIEQVSIQKQCGFQFNTEAQSKT